jgi:hypothetical protein
MWQLAAIAFCTMGWQLFPDGPLANYIITAVFAAGLCMRVGWRSRMWPAYAFGALVSMMTAGCGGLYVLQADGYSMLCDKGTGLPVSMITGLLAVLVGIWILVREKKS